MLLRATRNGSCAVPPGVEHEAKKESDNADSRNIRLMPGIKYNFGANGKEYYGDYHFLSVSDFTPSANDFCSVVFSSLFIPLFTSP